MPRCALRYALDYLLKPFSAERFRSALATRASTSQRRKMDDLSTTSPALREAPPRRNRLMIKSGGRIHFVRMTDIDWCEAAGNYVGFTSPTRNTSCATR